MRARLILAVAAIVFADVPLEGASTTTTAPPASTSTTASSKNEPQHRALNDTARDQQQSEPKPSVAAHKQMGASHRKDEPRHDRYEKKNYRASLATAIATWFLVIGTAALVVVGWKIGARQLKLMQGSYRATARAARAATRDARNTMTALKQAQLAERAWIALELMGVSGMTELLSLRDQLDQLSAGPEAVVHLNATWQFQNGGKTVARVRTANCKFELSAKLSDPPNYGSPEEARAPDFVIPPGSYSEGEAELPLTGEQVRWFFRLRHFLAFYGFMTYLDIWGEPHETRAAFVYVSPRPGGPSAFHPVNDPASYFKAT